MSRSEKSKLWGLGFEENKPQSCRKMARFNRSSCKTTRQMSAQQKYYVFI